MSQPSSNSKKFKQQLEKLLNSFETISEWPDIIQFLSSLQKLLQSKLKTNSNSTVIIPHELILSKRLTQCLNQSLPSGVHSKALDCYSLLLKLNKNFVYFYGLIGLQLSTSVKLQYYLLLENIVNSLEGKCNFLEGLILSLLEEEEESSEFIEIRLKIFNKLRKFDLFYESLFLSFLKCFPSLRQSCLNLMQIVLSETNLTTVVTNELTAKLFVSVYCLGLTSIESSSVSVNSVLVQRISLDLLLTYLPLNSNNLVYLKDISNSDCDLLMESALCVLLRKDMSLNRRLYSWLISSDKREGDTVVSDKDATTMTEAANKSSSLTPSSNPSSYNNKFNWSIRVLGKMIKGELFKPVKILISLLDKSEIGLPIVNSVLINVFESVYYFSRSDIVDNKNDVDSNNKSHNSNNTNSEIVQLGNMLIDIVDPLLIFSKFYIMLSYCTSNSSNDSCTTDNQNSDANTNLYWCELLLFSLENNQLRDEDSLNLHTPLLLIEICNKIVNKLHETEFKQEINLLLKSIFVLFNRIPEHLFVKSSNFEVSEEEVKSFYVILNDDIDFVYSSELYKLLKHKIKNFLFICFTSFEKLLNTSLKTNISSDCFSLISELHFCILEKYLKELDKYEVKRIDKEVFCLLVKKSCLFDDCLIVFFKMLEVGYLRVCADEVSDSVLIKIFESLWKRLRNNNTLSKTSSSDLADCKVVEYILRLHTISLETSQIIEQQIEKRVKQHKEYEEFSFFLRQQNNNDFTFSFFSSVYYILDLLNGSLEEKRIAETFLKCSVKSLVKVIVEPILFLLVERSVFGGGSDCLCLFQTLLNVFRYSSSDKLIKNLESAGIYDLLSEFILLCSNVELSNCCNYLELLIELLLINLVKSVEVCDLVYFLTEKIIFAGGNEKLVFRIKNFVVDVLLDSSNSIQSFDLNLQAKLVLILHLLVNNNKEENEEFNIKLTKLLVSSVSDKRFRQVLPHYLEFISSSLDYLNKNYKVIVYPLIKVLVDEIEISSLEFLELGYSKYLNADIEIPLLLNTLEKLYSNLISLDDASQPSASHSSPTPRNTISSDIVSLFSYSSLPAPQPPNINKEILINFNSIIVELVFKLHYRKLMLFNPYRLGKLFDCCVKFNVCNALSCLVFCCDGKENHFELVCFILKEYGYGLVLKSLIEVFCNIFGNNSLTGTSGSVTALGVLEFVLYYCFHPPAVSIGNDAKSETEKFLLECLEYLFQLNMSPFYKEFVGSNNNVSVDSIRTYLMVLKFCSDCLPFISDAPASFDTFQQQYYDYYGKLVSLVSNFFSKHLQTRNNSFIRELLSVFKQNFLLKIGTISKKSLVVTTITDFETHVLGPCLKYKLYPEFYVSIMKELVSNHSLHSTTFKVWRKSVIDHYMDLKFFASVTNIEMLKGYQTVINNFLLLENSYHNSTTDQFKIIDDLLNNRINTNFSVFNSASGITFSSSSNRDYERALYLRKVSFIIFSGGKDQYIQYLNVIDDKLVEILKMPLLDRTLLESEVYLTLRVLLIKFSPKCLTNLWPKLLTELIRMFENLLHIKETYDYSFLCCILNACKFLDLVFLLDCPEFQSFIWMFINTTSNSDLNLSILEKVANKFGGVSNNSLENDYSKRRLLIDSKVLNVKNIKSFEQLMFFFNEISRHCLRITADACFSDNLRYDRKSIVSSQTGKVNESEGAYESILYDFITDFETTK